MRAEGAHVAGLGTRCGAGTKGRRALTKFKAQWGLPSTMLSVLFVTTSFGEMMFHAPVRKVFAIAKTYLSYTPLLRFPRADGFSAKYRHEKAFFLHFSPWKFQPVKIEGGRRRHLLSGLGFPPGVTAC